MQIINIANAELPEDINNVNYINTPKCKIEGIIKEIKSQNGFVCGNNIYIKVIGVKDYLLRATKRTEVKCDSDFGGYTYLLNENLPNIGDKVEYIVDKDQHYIMSKNGKLEYGTGKVDLCENNILENYISQQNNNSYSIPYTIPYTILILIILLPILSIYIYKKFKKI